MIRQLSIAVFTTVCTLFGGANAIKAETLTFDELGSPTPVDGLTIKGVTFDFKIDGVDSTDATYNLSFDVPPEAPENFVVNLQQPFLEGNAKGVLTLDFATPISELQFAAALPILNTLAPGFTVELFDPELQSLGITPVETNPLVFLSEGLFTYSGVPVIKAVVDFDETKLGFDEVSPPRFIFDNLSYTSVPEASSLTGLLALVVLGGASQLSRLQRTHMNAIALAKR